jgi:hypothetical protein
VIRDRIVVRPSRPKYGYGNFDQGCMTIDRPKVIQQDVRLLIFDIFVDSMVSLAKVRLQNGETKKQELFRQSDIWIVFSKKQFGPQIPKIHVLLFYSLRTSKNAATKVQAAESKVTCNM